MTKRHPDEQPLTDRARLVQAAPFRKSRSPRRCPTTAAALLPPLFRPVFRVEPIRPFRVRRLSEVCARHDAHETFHKAVGRMKRLLAHGRFALFAHAAKHELASL